LVDGDGVFGVPNIRTAQQVDIYRLVLIDPIDKSVSTVTLASRVEDGGSRERLGRSAVAWVIRVRGGRPERGVAPQHRSQPPAWPAASSLPPTPAARSGPGRPRRCRRGGRRDGLRVWRRLARAQRIGARDDRTHEASRSSCGQTLWQDRMLRVRRRAKLPKPGYAFRSPHPELNRGPRPYRGLRSQRCGAHLGDPSETPQFPEWWVSGGLQSPPTTVVHGRAGDP